MTNEQQSALKAYAESLWDWMNASQKTGVRFGLFPAELMRNATGIDGMPQHELTVALMDIAQRKG